MAPSSKKLVRGLATALVATVVALVLAETGTRLWLFGFASDQDFSRYATLAELRERRGEDDLFFVRHRYLGFVGRPNFASGLNRHNALGFRGEEIERVKPPGELRIACVGGSTTYTNAVEDWRKAYPAVLERELAELGHPEVRVINAGLHGWTSWETLVNFEFRLLDLDPDLVVVYHAINDLKCRMVWPPEEYRGDNSGALSFTPSLFVPPFWQESALVRVIGIRSGRLQSQRELELTLDLKAKSGYWTQFRNQLLRGSYPRGVFRDVGADRMLEACPPIYFERNLAALIEIADAHGIDVLLATFAYRREEMGGTNPGTDIAAAGIEEMNGVLRDLARRTPAALYDFAAEMPTDAEHFADDVHVNETGAALKGRLFARAIVQRL